MERVVSVLTSTTLLRLVQSLLREKVECTLVIPPLPPSVHCPSIFSGIWRSLIQMALHTEMLSPVVPTSLPPLKKVNSTGLTILPMVLWSTLPTSLPSGLSLAHTLMNGSIFPETSPLVALPMMMALKTKLSMSAGMFNTVTMIPHLQSAFKDGAPRRSPLLALTAIMLRLAPGIPITFTSMSRAMYLESPTELETSSMKKAQLIFGSAPRPWLVVLLTITIGLIQVSLQTNLTLIPPAS